MKQDNLARFAVKSLAEHSTNPEVQLQEILSLIIQEDRWDDFKAAELPNLFQTLTRKFEQVNEKLSQAENDTERLQSEMAAIQSGGNDRNEEINNARLQRDLIEQDYIKLNAQL